MIPLVYSLCGRAQGVAARAALTAARGAEIESHVDADVWVEAVREHAWKLFVDWPGQLGQNPDEAFFVRLMRTPAEQRAALIDTLAVHALPARLRDAVGNRPIADLFGQRVRERMADLSDWLADQPGHLGMLAAACRAPGVGEASVTTARGRLLHRLTLDGERVADYCIDAPTDLHFSPQGEVARLLKQLCGMTSHAAERQARLLALAFDPCVPWDCRVD